MAICKFILVRHGETEWNTQEREMGQLDSPLTAMGIRQAELLAARMKHHGFSALYIRDLPRAFRTAEKIAVAKGMDIRIEPRLRERNIGFFQFVLGMDPMAGSGFKRRNAAINMFEYVNGKWVLDTWGDISHLQDPGTLDDPHAGKE